MSPSYAIQHGLLIVKTFPQQNRQEVSQGSSQQLFIYLGSLKKQWVNIVDRRKKRLISWTVLACSFILLILLFPIVGMMGVGGSRIASVTFTTLVILLFGSIFAAIHYSRDGWRIEGSTLEWILAAMIAPFLTLLLYFVSKSQEKKDTIDIQDHGRLERL